MAQLVSRFVDATHQWDYPVFKALNLIFLFWFLDKVVWQSEVGSKVMISFSCSCFSSPQGCSQAVIRVLFTLAGFRAHLSLSLDFGTCNKTATFILLET